MTNKEIADTMERRGNLFYGLTKTLIDCPPFAYDENADGTKNWSSVYLTLPKAQTFFVTACRCWITARTYQLKVEGEFKSHE